MLLFYDKLNLSVRVKMGFLYISNLSVGIKKKPPLARGGWQVFEEPNKAISLMRLQKRAEKIISTLITNRRNPMKFLRTVGMHFEKLRKAVEIQ